MPSRPQYAETAAAGRFPLRPGKPLVHRRRNGAWGYTCICHGHNHPRLKAQATESARHNCNNWAHAMREALEHVAWHHKTPAHYEIEALETAYALPAAERVVP